MHRSKEKEIIIMEEVFTTLIISQDLHAWHMIADALYFHVG